MPKTRRQREESGSDKEEEEQQGNPLNNNNQQNNNNQAAKKQLKIQIKAQHANKIDEVFRKSLQAQPSAWTELREFLTKEMMSSLVALLSKLSSTLESSKAPKGAPKPTVLGTLASSSCNRFLLQVRDAVESNEISWDTKVDDLVGSSIFALPEGEEANGKKFAILLACLLKLIKDEEAEADDEQDVKVNPAKRLVNRLLLKARVFREKILSPRFAPVAVVGPKDVTQQRSAGALLQFISNYQRSHGFFCLPGYYSTESGLESRLVVINNNQNENNNNQNENNNNEGGNNNHNDGNNEDAAEKNNNNNNNQQEMVYSSTSHFKCYPRFLFDPQSAEAPGFKGYNELEMNLKLNPGNPDEQLKNLHWVLSQLMEAHGQITAIYNSINNIIRDYIQPFLSDYHSMDCFKKKTAASSKKRTSSNTKKTSTNASPNKPTTNNDDSDDSDQEQAEHNTNHPEPQQQVTAQQVLQILQEHLDPLLAIMDAKITSGNQLNSAVGRTLISLLIRSQNNNNNQFQNNNNNQLQNNNQRQTNNNMMNQISENNQLLSSAYLPPALLTAFDGAQGHTKLAQVAQRASEIAHLSCDTGLGSFDTKTLAEELLNRFHGIDITSDGGVALKNFVGMCNDLVETKSKKAKEQQNNQNNMMMRKP